MHRNRLMLRIIFVVTYILHDVNTISKVGNPIASAYPCKNSTQVLEQFEQDRAPEEENEYGLHIDLTKYGGLGNYENVYIKVDAVANITLTDKGFARIRSIGDGLFKIRTFKKWTIDNLALSVQGVQGHPVPNILSIEINGEEICKEPVLGIWDSFIKGDDEITAVANPTSVRDDVNPTCGKRLIDHTELITNGQGTSPGDWPWHVALYSLENKGAKQNYRCGGTLVSKTAVITASHCVTVRGVPIIPQKLKVVLGKYNLFGGDTEAEEREVFEVKAHPNFNYTFLRNDIAILKLSTEAVYTNYIQPACLWEDQNNGKIQIFGQNGTLAGWGFNERDTLSNTLMKAELPIISDVTCLLSFASFYEKFLNENSFCAGYRNGTNACNGDSGGGLLIPRTINSFGGPETQIWFLRGIVSLSVSRKDKQLCDPKYYVIFTDVARYTKWIKMNL